MGMSLAGINELHGSLGVIDDSRETVEVTEQEVGTLVCCESSGKCYCKGLLIQVRADVHQSARADMPLKHV